MTALSYLVCPLVTSAQLHPVSPANANPSLQIQSVCLTLVGRGILLDTEDTGGDVWFGDTTATDQTRYVTRKSKSMKGKNQLQTSQLTSDLRLYRSFGISYARMYARTSTGR